MELPEAKIPRITSGGLVTHIMEMWDDWEKGFLYNVIQKCIFFSKSSYTADRVQTR